MRYHEIAKTIKDLMVNIPRKTFFLKEAAE